MGLFDQSIFSRVNYGSNYLKQYTEEFANALELSYKDFLMAVADKILRTNEDYLYGILDVAKKVEAEIVADKDPESQRRLEAYKKTVMDTSSTHFQALNEYEHSLLSEVYTKYCLPEVRQQIVDEIFVKSGISPHVLETIEASRKLSSQQKMDAVATHLCKKYEEYENFECPDPYADKIYKEMNWSYDAKERGYKRESYYGLDLNKLAAIDKERAEKISIMLVRENLPHGINMLDQNGLAAISKELGITDKNALRDSLITKYVESKPQELSFLIEKVISGNYPGLSLKELKDIVPKTKVMSNKEFCSFVCNKNMDHGFYDLLKSPSMFEQANQMLDDTPNNNARKNAWKELGVSLNEVVTDIVLANGKEYVDTYFRYKNMDMDIDKGLKSIDAQKTAMFKNIVVKNMPTAVFRQKYPALASAIHDVAKADPAKYEPMIAAIKKTARDNVISMYNSNGLKAYLENKDPWNSLHPTHVSTIVNARTHIAYERDKENTPTFYVFGTVDQKMLKDVNEVIADRLKTKGAPEGKEYHIVISDGKAEDSAYKANLGNPKSLSAITPSEENKETRQWLQPIVKYKVDNGYEKYPSKPKPKGPERMLNQSGGRSF